MGLEFAAETDVDLGYSGDRVIVNDSHADVYLKEGAYDKANGEMEAYLRVDPDGPLRRQSEERDAELESSGVRTIQRPNP